MYNLLAKTPAPVGSAFHINFVENTAWRNGVLLGTASALVTTAMTLQPEGLRISADQTSWTLNSAILTLIQTGTVSAVLETGPLSSQGATAYGRMLGDVDGNWYMFGTDEDTADTEKIGIWDGAEYLLASPLYDKVGYSANINRFGCALTTGARSLVFNGGTVASDTGSVAQGSWTGAALGNSTFVNGKGFYKNVTFYNTKLPNETLRKLTQ